MFRTNTLVFTKKIFLYQGLINPILDIKIRLFVCNAQTNPSWILKWGGLENSGRILMSSNEKTKIIAFCLKKIF